MLTPQWKKGVCIANWAVYMSCTAISVTVDYTINMTDQQVHVIVRRWRLTVTQPMEWWYQLEEMSQSMR